MGYVAPTWQNGGPPALNAKNMQDISDNLAYVSNHMVNPNLLDNWYFGHPVNQRGGKIIQQGVNIYSDSTLETLIGPAAYACPVVELTSTYAKVQDAKNTSSYYYAAPGNVVQGYTGQGYGIDRWKIGSNGTLTIQNGYITFSSNDEISRNLEEYLEGLPAGTYTLSALVENGAGARLVAGANDTYYNANISDDSKQVVSVMFVKTTTGPFTAYLQCPNKAVSWFSVKLELGTQQTLAHQENGVWALNEIPDYGEQLRRCQRYYQRLKASSGYMRFGISQPYTDTAAGVFILLQGEMRTAPTMSSGGNFALFAGSAFHGVNLSLDTTSPYNVTLKATGTGLPGISAQLLANADTNAYIEFSADL